MAEQGVPAYDGDPRRHRSGGTCSPGYADYLKKLVDLSAIRPLKVAVDAGNGMGGHTVPKVFEGLPITLVPLYFELDGTFPNHEANPIEPGEPARPAARGDRAPGPTSAWPSTGTPTAASSWTSAGEIVSPVGARRADRRSGSWPASRARR